MKIVHCTLIALIALAPSAVWAKAKIAINPDINHPKGTISVKGSAFQANESIDVRWDDKKLLFTVESDGSGNFARQKTKVPKSALPGAHTLAANGANGDSAKAAFTVSTPWVEFGFTPANTRDNVYENVISAKNVANLTSLWTASTPYQFYSSAAVANGVVYIPSVADKLYAFNATTGTVLWTTNCGGFSAPAIGKDVVYVGCATNDHKFGAFDANTGSTVWVVTGQAGFESSSPAVVDGVVYVGSDDHKLYAFDASTGNELWSATTGNEVKSSPAVANGVVYVGSDDDKLYALDAATGSTLWTAVTGGSIYSSPAVAKGAVYVASQDDNLYAFDASTGSKLWSAATGIQFNSSPAVANGLVYVGSGDNLDAFDATTGVQLWTASTGDYVYSPSVANGVVYVGSDDDNLYAFDAATGTQLWSATTGFHIQGSPAVSDGVVYIGSGDHSVYAFALKGGTTLRTASGIF